MPDVSFQLDVFDLSWPAVALVLVASAALVAAGLRRPRSLAAPAGGLLALVLLLAAGWSEGGNRRLWLLIALAVAAFGLTIRLSRPTWRRLAPGVRLAVALFRLAVLAAALLLLVRPTVRWTRVHHDRPRLAVVFDDSRSMQTRDVAAPGASEPLSRAAAVDTALRATRPAWQRIEREFDVRYFAFADRSVPLLSPQIRADGRATSLSAGLLAPLEVASEEGAPAAILVFSDGADNLPRPADPLSAARRVSAGGTAILAVGVGSEEPTGQTRSILARGIDAPPRALLGTRLPIRAEFECRGLADTEVAFTLAWDDKPLDQRIETPGDVRSVIRVEFDLPAEPAGFHTLTVSAAPRRGPWEAGPTVQRRFVHVIDEQLPVLHVESRPRSESAFLLRALAGERRFRVERVLLVRPGDGTRTNPLPCTAGAWQQYSVVILGDVVRRELSRGQIEALRDAVRDLGTGLIVLGGSRSAGRGGFFDSALADVLPVDGATASASEAVVPVEPTAAGSQHPLFGIASDDGTNEGTIGERWSRLPGLPVPVRVGAAKPAAEVLAAAADGAPLVVSAVVGNGRVLVVAFDASWRWAMHSNEGAALHRQFWRQAVIWAANRRPRIHVSVDRAEYDLAFLRGGGCVQIEAYVIDGLTGRTVDGAQVEVTLSAPGSELRSVTMSPGDICHTGCARPAAAGEYRVQLHAMAGGRPLGEAETQFIVTESDIETAEPLANLELLRQVAAATAGTGGAYAPLSELGAVLGRLAAGDYRRPRTETRSVDVLDELRWPVLLVVVVLLLLEWTLRKRAGLP